MDRLCLLRGEFLEQAGILDAIGPISAALGAKPALSLASRILDELLSPFGFGIPSLGLTRREAFVVPGERALVLRTYEPGLVFATGQRQSKFDVLAIGLKPEQVIELFKDALDVKLEVDTHETQAEVERIRRILGELSPNGKSLSEANIREAARRLYDDDLRAGIGALISIYGENPIPEQYVSEELQPPKDALVNRVLNDEELAKKRFVIKCSSCGTDHLLYSLRKFADSALRDEGAACSTCGKKGTLTRATSYVLSEGLQRGFNRDCG